MDPIIFLPKIHMTTTANIKSCEQCRRLILNGRDGHANETDVQHFTEHTAEMIAEDARKTAERIAKFAVGGRTMLGTDIWREVGRKLS